jgi:uncharacterized protein YcaQ
LDRSQIIEAGLEGGHDSLTIDELRRYAVARSLFPPTSLPKALEAFGFVQADPIRAPARAQDLTLRHRVTNYRAGDLERHYLRLHAGPAKAGHYDLHEDFFINYGFVTDRVFHLMHPRRQGQAPWSVARGRHVKSLLEFIRTRGPVHPRQVDDHFSLGTVTNYWGGSSSATTHLLDSMHYRGLLRVVRREAGIRIYGVHEDVPEKGRPATSAKATAAKDNRPLPGGAVDARERRVRLDALVDVVVNIYAPLPAASLAQTVRRLRYASPQWSNQITGALQRARRRLAHARVDGVDWYWPTSAEATVGKPAHAEAAESTPGEDPAVAEVDDAVRLLAPFDPVVWDRRRFELLWNWAYRFEAYTPVTKRRWGYYALPLLWRDRVIGWANAHLRPEGYGGQASTAGHELTLDVGYIAGRPPRDRRFRQALDDEHARFCAFLGLAR